MVAVLRRCLVGSHLWGLVYRNFRDPVGRVRDQVSPAPTLAKFVMFVKIERASPLRQSAVDVFASSTKFDSGTGWPSFWGSSEQRRRSPARRAPRPRFRGPPAPTDLRYCINGVALTSKASLTPKGPEYNPLRVLLTIVSSCVLLVLPARILKSVQNEAGSTMDRTWS